MKKERSKRRIYEIRALNWRTLSHFYFFDLFDMLTLSSISTILFKGYIAMVTT